MEEECSSVWATWSDGEFCEARVDMEYRQICLDLLVEGDVFADEMDLLEVKLVLLVNVLI